MPGSAQSCPSPPFYLQSSSKKAHTPKILRRYFLYNRKLLADLSRCGWESLKTFFQEAVPEEDAVPGAVIAIQSFGDFLGFNSHLHVLASDGCFYGQGLFRVAPRFETKDLEMIFRHKVFKMMLSKGKSPAPQEQTITGRSGRHADVMAPFGFQCLLWPQNSTRRGRRHGKSGAIYHSRLFLPGENDLQPRRGQGYLPIQGWERREGL